ncbi:MAG: hypothetical protein R2698_12300 [Microthrixaceae bacterium]
MREQFRHARRRRAAARRGLAAVLGLLVSSTLIWRASQAAFSTTTANASNSFAASAVTLSDDDSGSAMFTLGDLVPSSTATRCIQVTYTGTSFQLAAIRLYSELTANVDDFADHLDVTIEQGTGGAFGNCSGFVSGSTMYTGTLADLAADHGDYTDGISGFTPSSGDLSRTYRFVVTLAADTPDASQSDSASASFTWEIHSA